MQAPIDVTEGNRKRKMLLQKLAQQQGIGTPASVARPVFGGGRPFFAFNNLPPAPKPQLTRPFPIPPGLARLLGPGGHGDPRRGEFSLRPGLPIGDFGEADIQDPGRVGPPGPPPPGTPPGGGSVGRGLWGDGAPMADPNQPPPADVGPSSWASHVQAAQAATAPTPSVPMWANEMATAQPVSPGAPGGMTPVAPGANPMATALASDLIPLGGGGYFNPNTGTVHGSPGSRWFGQ